MGHSLGNRERPLRLRQEVACQLGPDDNVQLVVLSPSSNVSSGFIVWLLTAELRQHDVTDVLQGFFFTTPKVRDYVVGIGSAAEAPCHLVRYAVLRIDHQGRRAESTARHARELQSEHRSIQSPFVMPSVELGPTLPEQGSPTQDRDLMWHRTPPPLSRREALPIRSAAATSGDGDPLADRLAVEDVLDHVGPVRYLSVVLR